MLRVLLVLSVAASGVAEAQSAARPNRIDIVAENDSTFRVSGSATAGLVYLRFTNRSADIQSAHLIAVAPGRSMDEAEQLVRANRPVQWMGNAGGIGPTGANRTVTLAQVLPPGSYFVVGRRVGRNGQPRHMTGQLARFTVTGTANEPGRIRVDGQITLEGRFQFFRTLYAAGGREEQLPANVYGAPLRRGERILRVENSGGGYHELTILHSRTSRPQAMTLFADRRPLPQGVTVIGGVGYMAPGQRVWLHLTMEPGVYTIFCPLRHRGNTPGHQVGEQIVQFVQ